jgi:hypothetical protein
VSAAVARREQPTSQKCPITTLAGPSGNRYPKSKTDASGGSFTDTDPEREGSDGMLNIRPQDEPVVISELVEMSIPATV